MKKKNFYFKQITVFIMLSLFFVSCEKTDSKMSGVFFDTTIVLKVQNGLGENLLNPENPNYINTDSVYLYQITNDGCEVLQYRVDFVDSTISKGFWLVGSGDCIMMKIFLDGIGIGSHYNGNSIVEDYLNFDRSKCTLLLKWNLQNTNTDTILTTFEKKGSSEYNVFDKVCINGNLAVLSRDDYWEKFKQGIFPVII